MIFISPRKLPTTVHPTTNSKVFSKETQVMKGTVSRKFRFIAAVTALASLLSFCNVYGEYYNDEKFEIYNNMNGQQDGIRYIVPNLYRQDSAYPYVKDFPVVVTDGVEYVPVSMFSLYSYIDVTYSKVTDNFYMINTKTNEYLSFDVNQGVAATSEGDTLDMETRIFHRTRYIPAKAVADVMGVTCETYDDQDHGVYALRISDQNASYSFDSLLKQYLPESQMPESSTPQTSYTPEPTPTPPTNTVPPTNSNPPSSYQELPTPSVPSNVQQTQPKPKPSDEQQTQTQPKPSDEQQSEPNSDPILSVEKRQVAIMVEAGTNKNTAETIKILTGSKISAAFSVNREYILSSPSDIRKITTGGHSLSVTLSDEEAQAVTKENAKEQVLAYLEGANEALNAVCHRKTRICTLPENVTKLFESDDELDKLLADNGYVLFHANVTADNTKNAFSVYTELSQGIVNAYPKNKAGLVKMIIPCNDNIGSIVSNLVSFISKYPNFTAIGADETMA